MGTIYKITSPTDRIYIGKTVNFRRRIITHRQSEKLSKSFVILINSFKKYGFGNHTFEIIEEVGNDLLNEREKFWISHYNSFKWNNEMGMNMTLGGDGRTGFDWSDSNRVETLYKNFFSKGNAFKGKKHTEETKKILSILAKERSIKNGQRIPQWGCEKSRLKIIRPVVVYNSNGHKISEHESVIDCANFYKIDRSNVTDSLLYRSWHIGKYLFKYKTEDNPSKIEVGVIKMQTVKRPVYYVFNSYLIEYPSSLEASVELGVPKTTINRSACYNKLKPIRTGHVFIYKYMYEKQLVY